MLDRINDYRAGRGLPALTDNVLLARAAWWQSVDLARSPWLIESGRWHEGADGSDIGARISRAGYRAATWKEIVGWGFSGDGVAMFNWWVNSPVHRDAILSDKITEAGVAYFVAPGSAWGHYWCVDFGRPLGTAVAVGTPRPYSVNMPVVVGAGETPSNSTGLDLLDYIRGDGRSYRVGNARGSFEVFQTQSDGERFWQVKAWDDLSVVNWEGFTVDGEFIRRDVDTSPGGGRFYRQFDAPWVRRFMRPGETFTQGKRVQFYRLDDCAPVEQYSGDVIDTIKLVARHARYTFPANGWEPVTVEDVVELEWVQGGEAYWFARGYGLVGWARRHSDPNSPQWSAICGMRPGVGRLERLWVGCI